MTVVEAALAVDLSCPVEERTLGVVAPGEGADIVAEGAVGIVGIGAAAKGVVAYAVVAADCKWVGWVHKRTHSEEAAG